MDVPEWNTGLWVESSLQWCVNAGATFTVKELRTALKHLKPDADVLYVNLGQPWAIALMCVSPSGDTVYIGQSTPMSKEQLADKAAQLAAIAGLRIRW